MRSSLLFCVFCCFFFVVVVVVAVLGERRSLRTIVLHKFISLKVAGPQTDSRIDRCLFASVTSV